MRYEPAVQLASLQALANRVSLAADRVPAGGVRCLGPANGTYLVRVGSVAAASVHHRHLGAMPQQPRTPVHFPVCRYPRALAGNPGGPTRALVACPVCSAVDQLIQGRWSLGEQSAVDQQQDPTHEQRPNGVDLRKPKSATAIRTWTGTGTWAWRGHRMRPSPCHHPRRRPGHHKTTSGAERRVYANTVIGPDQRERLQRTGLRGDNPTELRRKPNDDRSTIPHRSLREFIPHGLAPRPIPYGTADANRPERLPQCRLGVTQRARLGAGNTSITGPAGLSSRQRTQATQNSLPSGVKHHDVSERLPVVLLLGRARRRALRARAL